MTLPTTVKQCDQDLAALEAADKIAAALKQELANVENMDTKELLKKAAKMMATRNFDLSEFGLNPDMINHVKTLEQISETARNKYRVVVEARKAELTKIEDA